MVVSKRETSNILNNLARSKFRSSFKLNKEDIGYINKMGLVKIKSHAKEFIIKRLSAESPKNDGRQTPFKGHPVFKAQHATATCCRKCLSRWHNISKRQSLKAAEIKFVVNLIMEWMRRQKSFYEALT